MFYVEKWPLYTETILTQCYIFIHLVEVYWKMLHTKYEISTFYVLCKINDLRDGVNFDFVVMIWTKVSKGQLNYANHHTSVF